jgi:hypothetical protein
MWIIAIIFLLLIWGNLSRKSPRHPLNSVNVNPVYPISALTPTAGDNFNSGNTMVAGVSEPSGAGFPKRLPVPIHALFPVAPPPIAIQTPKPPLRIIPRPVPANTVSVPALTGIQQYARYTATVNSRAVRSRMPV